MLNKTIALALAGALLSSATIASAETVDTRTTGVTYADLDLSSPDGRQELDRRIERAAKSVCGTGERSTGSNMATRESRECYRQARQQLDRHFAAVLRTEQRGG